MSRVQICRRSAGRALPTVASIGASLSRFDDGMEALFENEGHVRRPSAALKRAWEAVVNTVTSRRTATGSLQLAFKNAATEAETGAMTHCSLVLPKPPVGAFAAPFAGLPPPPPHGPPPPPRP